MSKHILQAINKGRHLLHGNSYFKIKLNPYMKINWLNTHSLGSEQKYNVQYIWREIFHENMELLIIYIKFIKQ